MNILKPRVLHLIDSTGFYGAERVVVTLCRDMQKDAFSSYLGCIMSRGAELPEVGAVAKNLGITVLPVLQLNKFDWKSLKKIIAKQKINIIHCHGYKPSLLSFIAENYSGRRIIITCHLWTNATMRLKIYSFLESRIMRYVQAVVAVSDEIKENIVKTVVNPAKVRVIFNGIEVEKWQKDTSFDCLDYRKSLGLRYDSHIIGLFGRLYAQKGHKYIFQTLSQLQNKKIELICVGDGPLKGELQQLARQLDIADRVHFLGFRKDVQNLLELTDLFVMPSLDEGLPMAMLEAMAMEKTVIATSVGAIPCVIENGLDGVLISSGSVEDLTVAVKNLIDDDCQRKMIGRNARSKVMSKYSSIVMSRQYCEIYRRMCRIAN